jgi:hypothetical protein
MNRTAAALTRKDFPSSPLRCCTAGRAERTGTERTLKRSCAKARPQLPKRGRCGLCVSHSLPLLRVMIFGGVLAAQDTGKPPGRACLQTKQTGRCRRVEAQATAEERRRAQAAPLRRTLQEGPAYHKQGRMCDGQKPCGDGVSGAPRPRGPGGGFKAAKGVILPLVWRGFFPISSSPWCAFSNGSTFPPPFPSQRSS